MYLRAMRPSVTVARLRRTPRTAIVDVGGALLVFAVAIADLSGGALHPLGAWIAGAVVTAVALVFRRRWPLPVLLVVVVSWGVLSLTTDPSSDPAYALFASLLATYATAAYAERRPAVASLAIALAFFAIGALLDGETPVGDVAFIWFLLGGAWVLGRALRANATRATALERHAEHLEGDREAQARMAVAVERARIARELHDVVAHAVSLMVLQAGGVRRRLGDDQSAEREALEAVEATGREAIQELRVLLGVVRDGSTGDDALEPVPRLERLDELGSSFAAAGLDVEITVDGSVNELGRGLELSAYRIVQEALTNSLKHSGGEHAQVVLNYGRRRLEIVVSDDGRGTANGLGTGNGLVGMRERALAYGGTLAAGPRDGGGFEVRAMLPMTGETP
jgi:signal transduction histidine kinase